MKSKRSEANPEMHSVLANARRLCVSATLFSAGMLALSGCGGSSSKTPTSPATGSPVIVGTQANSLPTQPGQGNVNRYAGIDVAAGGSNWNWRISQPDHSYSYQLQQGVASVGSGANSGGLFTTTGDFEFLSDTTNSPYTFSGLNVEIPTGVAIFEPAFGGFPTGPLAIGVLQQQTGCLAPDGSIQLNFLVIPANVQTLPPYKAATSALYGTASLAYNNGTFSYEKVAQFALGGASASAATVPFTDGYCIQAEAGYGIQSTVTSYPGVGEQSLLTYMGVTGQFVGEINVNAPTGPLSTAVGVVGMVQPSSAIDLSKVTAATYRGVYDSRSAASQYADPAYFGRKSGYITSPVFTQTGTSLVGGYEDFFSLLFTNPPPRVTGDHLLDFGSQDSSNPGLFPSAKLTEPDPSNLCPSSQQSTGSDGLTYCTFPVVALVGQSYGRYVIYVGGLEPTTGAAMFYALLQD